MTTPNTATADIINQASILGSLHRAILVAAIVACDVRVLDAPIGFWELPHAIHCQAARVDVESAAAGDLDDSRSRPSLHWTF